MKIHEVRRTARVFLEEGDDVAFRVSSNNPEPSDGPLAIGVYVRIDGVMYGTAFRTPNKDYLRAHIRDNNIDVREVLDADGRDLNDLDWEKYKP